jgi:hypothetical protein
MRPSVSTVTRLSGSGKSSVVSQKSTAWHEIHSNAVGRQRGQNRLLRAIHAGKRLSDHLDVAPLDRGSPPSRNRNRSAAAFFGISCRSTSAKAPGPPDCCETCSSGAGYGAMFIPQVAMAILASSSGPWLARRFGLRGVLLLGLGGDLVSMALLSASPLLIGSGAACVFAVRLHRRARQRLRRDGDGAERLGRGLVARPRGRRGVDLERRWRFSRRGRRIACAPGRRAGAHASCASQAVLAICRGGAALWPR